MSTMKNFFIIAICLILFFLFSNFLINVGLNASYKDITRRDYEESRVEVSKAQSTLVNGKVRGTIINTKDDYLTGKFVRFDFYSKNNQNMGTKYIQINTTENITTQDFNFYFELQNITSYSVSIVDKKEEKEIKLIEVEPNQSQIILATVVALLIFW